MIDNICAITIKKFVEILKCVLMIVFVSGYISDSFKLPKFAMPFDNKLFDKVLSCIRLIFCSKIHHLGAYIMLTW